MKFHLRLALILALVFSGISTPFAIADDSSATTSETDNYGSLSGSAVYKQGFEAGLSNYLSSSGTFTVEAWLLPSDSMSATTGSIFVKTDTFQYEIASGIYQVIFNYNGWKSYLSTGIKARYGEWQHVAFVKNGTTFSFYLNGNLAYQLTDATNVPATLNNSSTYTSIGSNPWNGSSNQPSPQGNLFAGGIDEVKVWSTARSQSEIRLGMQTKISPSASGLISSWDFNGAATSTIYDRTGVMNMSAYGTPAPTYPDVKLTNITNFITTYSFTRTYLNGIGGWKVPTGVTRVSALAIGGGGGGGDNVGAGGAGGGGYYIPNATVNPGDLISVKVGFGGAGGSSTAAGSVTYDGTYLINGQSGDSSTVTIGSNNYLGGGGGGGRTFWDNNTCGGSGTPTTWSIAGTFSGSGGTGYTGGLGGIPSTTQSIADGATGFTSAFNSNSAYYGSGGGAGGGHQSRVGGVGANSKGGNGFAVGGTAGTSGSPLSGAGGGGGATSCGIGGNGGSGVVLLSMPSITASISTLVTATFRNQSSLVATVSYAGKVTFSAQGKRIGGCINVPTTGSGPYSATCNWKPAIRGSVAVTALYTPTASPSNAMTLNWGKVFVLNRSGNR
ncbi:Concanavalin A-like lectin/glucanases superfamily [Candidatus Nanopelagicaceae bacterium]